MMTPKFGLDSHTQNGRVAVLPWPSKQQRNCQGFTLIELMVVVLLIGILSLLTYPAYSAFARKARYAEAKQQLGTIARELQRLQLEQGHYPDEVAPNIRPDGVTHWPETIPFDSTFDYDHWAIGGDRCYVQLAFWGESNQSAYAPHQEHGTPGKFTPIDDNVLLTVSAYDCSIASPGPVQ